jgi:hypothetical protein
VAPTVSVLGQSAVTYKTPIHKQVEVDFGTTPVETASFTITDNDVQSNSIITALLSYDAPTGKDQDENEMDDIDFICSAAGGSFTLFGLSRLGYVADKFKVNYTIG